MVLPRCKIGPLLRVLCHVFPNVTCFEGHEDAIAKGRYEFQRHHAGHINYDWKLLFVPENHQFSRQLVT